MSTLYITQQDATLRKIDERLRVTVKKDVLLDVPMIKVSQVVLYGRITVTAATVAALMERQIEICYLTQHGQYLGRLQPKFSKNSLLRRVFAVPFIYERLGFRKSSREGEDISAYA